MALTPNNAILNENEKYYLGDPYITTISMKCYNDDNNLVTESMVISNQFVPVIPRYYIARYENSPDWVIIKYNAPKYLYIGLNCARPPFNDKRFRQAIAKAVNKKEIKRSVYQDAGWIMWGPYPEQSPAYTTIQPHKFNPFKAKEELENLGFRDSDGDGFLDTNGKLLEISLLYNSHNQDYLRIAQIFQQNLQDIGIKVNFDGRGDAEIEQLCYFDKNFECVLNEVEIGIDPDIYKLFHSSQNQAGQSNYVSYSNPDVDHILSTARTMTNQNLRYSSYKDAARIIAEEVPYIFLWTGEICVGKSRKVHMPPNDINQVNIWDLIYKWWLD
jgi:peptide/nickel transport system substrate-binding protein